MKKIARLKNISGFTLSELMVAAGILAFTISALLLTFISCLLLNESNNNRVIAANDAQYVMERLKSMVNPDIETFDPAILNLVNLRNESITLNRSYPYGAGTRILEVTVNVNWTERGGDRNYNLSTQFFD